MSYRILALFLLGLASTSHLGCNAGGAAGPDNSSNSDSLSDSGGSSDTGSDDPDTPVEREPNEPLLEETLTNPDEDSTFIVANQLSITIPAGAIDTSLYGDSEVTLVVKGGPLLEAEERPWKLLQSYEIKLLVDGEPVQPAQPLEIGFRIFPSQLRAELEPAEQLFIARLDDEVGEWTELPVEIITKQDGVAWLITTTYYLSGFGSFILNYPYVVLAVPPWRFFFLEDVNAVGLGAYDIFELVVQYRAVLDQALLLYSSWGFTMPKGPVSVYVLPDASGAQYNPLTGSITLTTVIADDAEARHEASHELFHLLQNTQLNYLSMDSRRWFVEAAAEYAAEQANGGSTGQLGKGLSTKYFRQPFTYTDGVQEYATGALVAWIVNGPTRFKRLHDAVFGAASLFGDPAEVFATSSVQLLKEQGRCTSCNSFNEALVEFATLLILQPNTWMSSDSIFTAWAEHGVTHTVAAKTSYLTVATVPWKATIAAAKIEDALVATGNFHPVYLWYPAEATCHLDAWHVPQDDVAKAVRLSVAVRDGGQAFTEVQAAPGDVLMVISTTPSSACDTVVEVRTVPFCIRSESLSPGGTIYQKCEDLDGVHMSDPSSCEGSIAHYRYMYCTPEGACAQTKFSGDCASDPTTPVCRVEGDPPKPYCTFAP